jgi:tetratricopeptide (TPR) repeat protein
MNSKPRRLPGRPVRWALAALALAVAFGSAAPWAGSSSANAKAGSSDEIKKKLEGLSPEEQIARLKELRERTPGDARVSFYLGNAFLTLARPDSAAAAYEEAVKLDSTYTKAYVNLGIALEDLKRFDEARRRYEQALSIDSTDVLARCHLGHYYHSRGDLQTAVEYYTRAIEIDPRSAQAHYNLGLAFADTRLFAEAMREWETVIKLSPKSELGRTAAENLRLIQTYVGKESPHNTK